MKRAKFKLVSPLQHATFYKCQEIISLICYNDKNKREYINSRYFIVIIIVIIIIITVIILSLLFSISIFYNRFRKCFISRQKYTISQIITLKIIFNYIYNEESNFLHKYYHI